MGIIDLIASRYDLNLSEVRLILEAIHNVEKDDLDIKEYEIEVTSFLELIDTKNVSEYSRVKDFCKTILSKPLEIPKGDGKFLYCNWFSNIEYDSRKRTIKYMFDSKLKPYLLELKDKFTKYDIRILLKFKSFYALRIYMLLKTQTWKGQTVEYTVGVDELRELMKLETKYKLYGHFKSRVLEIAKKYINEISDIEIDFEDVKIGRKVQEVKFIVKRKPMKLENIVYENIEKMNFKQFKEYIISHFTGQSLCNCIPGYKKDVVIGLNVAGFLKNEKFGDDLTPDAAKKFWQWLFENKHRVGEIIEIDLIEKRIDNIIGKKLITKQKSVFGHEEDIEFAVKEIIKVEDDKYILKLIDPHGAIANTNKPNTLEEIEKLLNK